MPITNWRSSSISRDFHRMDPHTRETPMARSALLALSAVIISSLTTASATALAQERRSSGFELPAIKGGYPGRTFEFDGEQARLLVREVLPIVTDDAARVSVQEDIILPIGVYAGLTFDIALNVTADSSICEERHAYIGFRYKGPDVDVREMRPAVGDGSIANHVFSWLRWSNRYFALPKDAASDDGGLTSCRSLAANTSGWRQASSRIDYISEKRRLAALITALGTLPMRQIHCVDPEKRPCDYERSKILSLVQASLPERSQSMVIPNEGAVSVYSHYGYGDAAQIDYTATLRAGGAERATSLNIHFSKSLPPPQI